MAKIIKFDAEARAAMMRGVNILEIGRASCRERV